MVGLFLPLTLTLRSLINVAIKGYLLDVALSYFTCAVNKRRVVKRYQLTVAMLYTYLNLNLNVLEQYSKGYHCEVVWALARVPDQPQPGFGKILQNPKMW